MLGNQLVFYLDFQVGKVCPIFKSGYLGDARIINFDRNLITYFDQNVHLLKHYRTQQRIIFNHPTKLENWSKRDCVDLKKVYEQY